MYRDPSAVDRSIVVVALNGAVAGVDRLTGNERWRNQLPGAGVGTVDVAIGSNRVFVTAGGSQLACLDYRNGQTLWTVATSSTGRGTILLDDDRIVVVKNGYVDCFDLAGQLLWKQELSGMGVGRAAVGVPGNVRQADDVSSRLTPAAGRR